MKLARGIGIFVAHVVVHPLRSFKEIAPAARAFFEGLADGYDGPGLLERELRRHAEGATTCQGANTQ